MLMKEIMQYTILIFVLEHINAAVQLTDTLASPNDDKS